MRLDKGFFSRATVECLQDLGVQFLLKVRDHHWVRRELGSWRRSRKSREITKDPAVSICSSSGTLYGGRLLSLEWRRTERSHEALFATERIVQKAHVLTNIPGLHALTAWRAYNHGAVVEQRIELHSTASLHWRRRWSSWRAIRWRRFRGRRGTPGSPSSCPIRSTSA